MLTQAPSFHPLSLFPFPQSPSPTQPHHPSLPRRGRGGRHAGRDRVVLPVSAVGHSHGFLDQPRRRDHLSSALEAQQRAGGRPHLHPRHPVGTGQSRRTRRVQAGSIRFSSFFFFVGFIKYVESIRTHQSSSTICQGENHVFVDVYPSTKIGFFLRNLKSVLTKTGRIRGV